jgi:hypothetical protein
MAAARAYGVGRTLDGELLALTAMFASTFVCSRLSLGTFSEAFAELGPSVTIDAGARVIPRPTPLRSPVCNGCCGCRRSIRPWARRR